MSVKGKNVIEASAGRSWNYHPVMQFYARLIEMATVEALAVRDLPPYSPDLVGTVAADRWDEAIEARDWIRRPAPSPHGDHLSYIVSFDHACEVLYLKADDQRVLLLSQIDASADFGKDEVYERMDYLTANPVDEVTEALFRQVRVVAALDQNTLFPISEAA